MKTRRDFLSDAAQSIIAASVGIPGFAAEKKVRIGIIGAENSHSVEYGRIFNRDKKFPGVEIAGIWGETEQFAKNSAEKGQIPWIVKDPAEFVGKIDALIVDHRHPKYHLEAAWPFVEAGIPTFIDKPFCYRVSEGKKFAAMVHSKGTPVTSFSTAARGASIQDLRQQVAAMKDLHHIISAGHCDIDSPYGGVFFYGVHQVQRIMEVFGEDVSAVRVSRSGDQATALLAYPSGRQVTMTLAKGRPKFSFAVVTDKGPQPLEPRVEGDPLAPYAEIVELFRNGKIARSLETLLKETAILEAIERSVSSDRWENV